jgi:hypothetical protein
VGKCARRIFEVRHDMARRAHRMALAQVVGTSRDTEHQLAFNAKRLCPPYGTDLTAVMPREGGASNHRP